MNDTTILLWNIIFGSMFIMVTIIFIAFCKAMYDEKFPTTNKVNWKQISERIK